MFEIFEGEKRKYISIDDTLYQYTNDNDIPCIIENISYDKSYTLKEISSNEVKINYDNTFTASIILENGKWVLNDPIFYCDSVLEKELNA